ncbi:amino acid kinase family protein [Bacilliculturomica massiliensis]|uniref:amino acid kinase family protein n=1 Tax=Bacilliculturomica massiliensis TaxID=1917867 RepID=UPI0010301F40|nr:ACT domain-containing protein [Bacilliculturomica massiliensis]
MNVVRKYGKNSINSAEKMKAVAEHLAAARKPGDGMVVVLSASCYAADGKNAAETLAAGLREAGVQTSVFAGFDPERFPVLELEEVCAAGAAAVVEGPAAAGNENDPVRCGAETLAVIIAAELGCDCEIYSDVSCVYSVDPELYPAARRLPIVTYEDMMELAALGTGPLEARSVELARKYDVRLFVTEALSEDHSRGTYVMNDSNYMKDMAVTGISTADNYTIATVGNMEDDGAAAAELFEVLGQLSVNVDMISKQIQADGRCAISFSCPGQDGPRLKKQLETDSRFAGTEVRLKENLAMISLVGVGMAIRSGVAGKVFAVLRKAAIPCYHITTSEISISLAVDMENKEKAVTAFGRAFEL